MTSPDVPAPAASAAPALPGGELYTVGIDFGTLSGRAVVARVRDGEVVGSAVRPYGHGVIETALPGAPEGAGLPPDWALQDPADWREVLATAVPAAVADAGIDPARVIGVGLDATSCTVLPVLRDGTPLCETRLRDRPHAWPKLWKHHAAQAQADRITDLAAGRGERWLARYGGRVSSEWQFAKALQILDEDPEVYAAAERMIEAADWLVWQLTGQESRSACIAGYKGLHQDGAYPDEEFLAALDPRFADFARTRLEHPLSPLAARAGGLTARAARATGLREGVAVAVGTIDAHVAAPAARAVENGRLLAIMGTSTCLIVSGPRAADVPGVCGIVQDGVVAGAWGYEAGQSAVGDIYAWWTGLGLPPAYLQEAAAGGEDLHRLLSRRAAGQPVGAHGLVALDWMNGNRSVLVDHDLSGVVVGLTLATRPEDVYLALLEATAFGSRVIVEALERGGVPVDEFVVTGGLQKNDLLMRIYADVLRRPVSLAGSEQGSALGAAVHAAVAAGAHPDVRSASAAMGRVKPAAYLPDQERADAYDELFAEYRLLYESFGGGGDTLLHRLRRIRNRARGTGGTGG